MLLTICPNCSAQFKVQPEQLNVRQGRVMCGRCREVFNAFQSLSRVEDSVASEAAPLPEAVIEATAADDVTSTLADMQTRTELASDPIFSRAEPAPLPAAFSSFSTRPVAPEAASRRPEPSPPALPASPFAPSVADLPRVNPPALTTPPISAFQDLDAVQIGPGIELSDEENPLLTAIPTSRRTSDAAPSRAWTAGALLLFVMLLAGAIYTMRTTLVSTYPQLRPALNQMCDLVGCIISWGRDESAFEIVSSDLIETPAKPGRILLTATLVNRSKTKQDLPSLELRLTDNANQIVVSRALHPRDYLGRSIAKDEGLAPGAELYVNLNLEVGSKPSASGYGLLPFYP
jgi:predicted Zn finger-like uncharacterized protein